MKSNARLLFAAGLAIIIVPSASFAAQKPESMDITVMLRGDIDPTKLKTETYAYVAFK